MALLSTQFLTEESNYNTQDFHLSIKLWFYEEESGWRGYEEKMLEGNENYIKVQKNESLNEQPSPISTGQKTIPRVKIIKILNNHGYEIENRKLNDSITDFQSEINVRKRKRSNAFSSNFQSETKNQKRFFNDLRFFLLSWTFFVSVKFFFKSSFGSEFS